MAGRWVAHCALGEALGLTAGLLWFASWLLAPGAPEPPGGRLGLWALLALSAVPEALILGLLQARGLRPALPGLDLGRFLRWTLLAGLAGWGLGGAAGLLLVEPGATGAAETRPALALLATAGIGAGAGALFGWAQGRALPAAGGGRRAWLWGNVAGWTLALPVVYAGASLGAEAEGAALRVAIWGVAGLAAGALIGAATLPAHQALARAAAGATRTRTRRLSAAKPLR
jgi:hypothetical protein